MPPRRAHTHSLELAADLAKGDGGVGASHAGDGLNQGMIARSPRRSGQELGAGEMFVNESTHRALKALDAPHPSPARGLLVQFGDDLVPRCRWPHALHDRQPLVGRRQQLVQVADRPALQDIGDRVGPALAYARVAGLGAARDRGPSALLGAGLRSTARATRPGRHTEGASPASARRHRRSSTAAEIRRPGRNRSAWASG